MGNDGPHRISKTLHPEITHQSHGYKRRENNSNDESPSIDEWRIVWEINKSEMWAIKENEQATPAAVWRCPENIILSKRTETQGSPWCI